MPIPANITDLSTTAGSNSPPGAESPTDGDGYLRAHASFIAILRDQLNGTSGTGTINDASFTGTMTGAATWSSLQTFAAGISVPTSGGNVIANTYTPTLTNVTNLDSSTASVCQYMRVGPVVTVSGKVVMNLTLQSGAVLGMSIPIASNFTDTGQLAGIGMRDLEQGGGNPFVSIKADATNDRARFDYNGLSSSGTDETFFFNFTYQII